MHYEARIVVPLVVLGWKGMISSMWKKLVILVLFSDVRWQQIKMRTKKHGTLDFNIQFGGRVWSPKVAQKPTASYLPILTLEFHRIPTSLFMATQYISGVQGHEENMK